MAVRSVDLVDYVVLVVDLSCFLYKMIVIITWFSLALIFFLSFLYDCSFGVYLINQCFSTVIDCSTERGRDTLFKTGMTVYIRVLFVWPFPDIFNQLFYLDWQAYIIFLLILSTSRLQRLTLRWSLPTPRWRTVHCFYQVSSLLVEYLPGSDKLYNFYRHVVLIQSFTYNSLIQRVYLLHCNTYNSCIILNNSSLKASKCVYNLKVILA